MRVSGLFLDVLVLLLSIVYVDCLLLSVERSLFDVDCSWYKIEG